MCTVMDSSDSSVARNNNEFFFMLVFCYHYIIARSSFPCRTSRYRQTSSCGVYFHIRAMEMAGNVCTVCHWDLVLAAEDDPGALGKFPYLEIPYFNGDADWV